MKSKCLLVIPFLFLILFSQQVSAQDSIPTKNDFKITLLSLGSGSSRFTYERAFSPRNSAELTFGVISWGWDWMNKTISTGVLVKAAYKWLLIPQKGAESWLAGFYVKPELVFADFDYVDSRQIESTPQHTRQVALLAECGYQLVFDWFVFDIYTGLGPTIGNGNDNNYYHSFMRFPVDGYTAFTAGFRLGVAF